MHAKLKNPARKFYAIVVAAQLLTLLGCAQSLTLQTRTEVPVPLARQLPLNVAVYYPEAFRNYDYQENSEDRPNWNISCGASQVALFEQLLPSMFAGVVHVDGMSYQGDQQVDFILVPEVEEMQFALPNETRTDLYEAWVKYRVRLYDTSGQPMGEWPVSGYGKSSTAFLKNRGDGLNNAIDSAFRDVGAKFTLGFAQSEVVQNWRAAGGSNERATP